MKANGKLLIALLCVLIACIGRSPAVVANDLPALPTAAQMAADPTVSAAIAQAWTDSQAGDKDNRHEEGAWIVQDTTTGALSVVRWPKGTRSSINPCAPPQIPYSRVVGDFHIHPNPPVDEDGNKWQQGPSKVDKNAANALGIPGIVRSASGTEYYGPATGALPYTPVPEPTSVNASEETWCFTFYQHLPALYLYVNPIEIYFVNVEEVGQPAPGGMDIDLNQIPELGGLAQLWYAPLPEEAICTQVTRDGHKIYASFEFTHEPTGYDVSAELSGTIIGNTVSFNINYYLPNELQNYSKPLNYSDCLSDMEGTASYSLPAVLTATYEGTITGDTIQGTFNSAIGGRWACWHYHDKEYTCAWGTTREELNFDGLLEWTFSNLRVSGDFRVDIGR